MPARSTAGATRASAAAPSVSGRSNISGRTACSGGRNASEILGAYPSSRRRLAQNAVSMIASRLFSSGAKATDPASVARAASMCRAKCSATRGAAARAPRYVAPSMQSIVASATLGQMGDAFELLETIRWTPGRGFFLLDRHLTRLAGSARHFGFPCNTADLRAALDRAVAASADALRVRLLLAHDGTARVECAVLDAAPVPTRVVFADAPIDPGDVFLYHKTTNRRVYDAAGRPDADDVILWNADRQVTETTIANIVAEIDGRKLTPPVECGLLPGTFRSQLLDDGVIEE